MRNPFFYAFCLSPNAPHESSCPIFTQQCTPLFSFGNNERFGFLCSKSYGVLILTYHISIERFIFESIDRHDLQAPYDNNSALKPLFRQTKHA